MNRSRIASSAVAALLALSPPASAATLFETPSTAPVAAPPVTADTPIRVAGAGRHWTCWGYVTLDGYTGQYNLPDWDMKGGVLVDRHARCADTYSSYLTTAIWKLMGMSIADQHTGATPARGNLQFTTGSTAGIRRGPIPTRRAKS
jgi:hypothetical protein